MPPQLSQGQNEQKKLHYILPRFLRVPFLASHVQLTSVAQSVPRRSANCLLLGFVIKKSKNRWQRQCEQSTLHKRSGLSDAELSWGQTWTRGKLLFGHSLGGLFQQLLHQSR